MSEVIVLQEDYNEKDIVITKLSDRLKGYEYMIKRAKRTIALNNEYFCNEALEDYEYARTKIRNIERALKGKHNIIIVTEKTMNIIRSGINAGMEKSNQESNK